MDRLGAKFGGRAVLAAALAALALVGCHKRGAEGGAAAASRGLQVEAYDPPIPKAPLKGRLETMTRYPQDGRAAAPAASSDLPADSSQAPEPRG